MYNQQDKPLRNEFSPFMGDRDEEQVGVKIYERPIRPAMPVWLLLLLIAMGMLLMWLFLQSL